jgi:hypothetical protein
MEQDLGAKQVQQGSHEGQTSMAHAARFLGRMGPARWRLVALMPSIFVPMDSSWPKIDYIKGAPAGHEKECHRNIETWNRSLGDRRSEGETPAGCCRCDLHTLQRLYLCHHNEEGVVHLWTMVYVSSYCISLLFFIVLALYELITWLWPSLYHFCGGSFYELIYEIAIVL